MSTDTSLSLLIEAMQGQKEPALWLLDEHGSENAAPRANPAIRVISNRFDVAEMMEKRGWQCEFSDLDFSSFSEGSLDAVFFRLAKEKPLSHYLINNAARLLKPGGRLILTGTKQQGVKSYAKNAGKCLGGGSHVKKHGNDYLATVTRGEGEAQPLDDKAYTQLRIIREQGEARLYSKPGLFGWDKIDIGSAMLAEYLPEFGVSKKLNSVLDLGCGYGYLSLVAHYMFPEAVIYATDNNAAAVAACHYNFEANGINGEVFADNCAAGLRKQFKLILCNPPFHQGFDVSRDMTEQFVSTARRLCHKNGMAAFVVNAFIPAETIATQYFKKVEIIENDGKFKLIKMLP